MRALFLSVAGVGAFLMYWAYKNHTITDLKQDLQATLSQSSGNSSSGRTAGTTTPTAANPDANTLD